jgi:hypothetical protein
MARLAMIVSSASLGKWALLPAQTSAVQQPDMSGGGIDLASRIRDYPLIFEIGVQALVFRVQ